MLISSNKKESIIIWYVFHILCTNNLFIDSCSAFRRMRRVNNNLCDFDYMACNNPPGIPETMAHSPVTVNALPFCCCCWRDIRWERPICPNDIITHGAPTNCYQWQKKIYCPSSFTKSWAKKKKTCGRRELLRCQTISGSCAINYNWIMC